MELIRQRLTQTLFAQTPYKVVSLALVFRRRSPQPDVDQMHQDKYTGAHVYQMPDPAPDTHPDVPGGLRWLISFGADRSMAYSRMVGGKLVPMQLPDGFATAQVIAQSARAAGAPRYKNGPRGDLYHGRINSEADGLEVTVRLDMRLPFVGDARRQAHVPSTTTSYAYQIFRVGHSYSGAGRGARPGAGKISEEDRFSKLHCGRCMKELSGKHRHKALNKGATYRICMVCYFELRAEQDEEAWTRPPACPSAAEGDSDCLCWCEPKQAAKGKRRKSTVSWRCSCAGRRGI
jgi:hypothetical protein